MKWIKGPPTAEGWFWIVMPNYCIAGGEVFRSRSGALLWDGMADWDEPIEKVCLAHIPTATPPNIPPMEWFAE